MDSGKNEEVETARKDMEGTRNEINIRLGQRDTALFGFLVAVGALGGVALGRQEAHPANPDILLMIPFLALAVAAVVAQHHIVIGSRERHIVIDIMPFLQERNAGALLKEAIPPGRYAMRDIRMRTMAHALVLFVPAVMVLILYTQQVELRRAALIGSAWSETWTWPMISSWVLAILCTLGTAVLLFYAHSERMEAANEIERFCRKFEKQQKAKEERSRI